MERLDNLNSKQTNNVKQLGTNNDLNRSFQELNAKLDSVWFNDLVKYHTEYNPENTRPKFPETEPVEKLIEELQTSVQEIEGPVKKKTPEYQEKTLRNKGKKVGRVRVYKKGIKRTLLATSFVIVGISAFIAGKSVNKRPIYQVSYNTLSTSYFDEPTYNGILYTVKSGDNLSSIIAKYESDPNKQAAILNQIMNYNNLNSSKIVIGDQIYLFGVPASMLEEYGYSDNFNYFDPLVEINVRFDFLDKVIEALSGNEDAQGYIQCINDLKEWYEQFKYSYIPGEDDELNEILNEVRELSNDALKYGYDFDFNKKAMPLSESTNYKNENERTNT